MAKSDYQRENEVRAARAAGRPVYYVAVTGWRWGVYIAPSFADRREAEAEAARCNATGGGCFSVEIERCYVA